MEQNIEATAPKPKRRFARNATKSAEKPAKTEVAKREAAKPKTTLRRKTKAVDDAQPVATARVTKAEIVIGLLSRPEGATIAQMGQATGWQQHSVRGFLAGNVKKKAGVTLSSEKTESVRTYRLTTSDGAPA